MSSLDLTTIKDYYTGMTDGQLQAIAMEDGHKLTLPAFQVLKNEYLKRGLDETHIIAAENNRQQLHEQQLQEIRESTPEKYEAAIWEYVFEEKEKNTPEKEIIAGLCARAVPEEKAHSMLTDTIPTLQQVISKHDKKASVNAFIILIGLAVTLFTFLDASIHGGTYIIAWGAVVFGLYDYYRGAKDRKKYKALLAAIEKQEALAAGTATSVSHR